MDIYALKGQSPWIRMECRGAVRVAAGLIALGMTKDMLRASLHYDLSLDLDEAEFERLYEAAMKCVADGTVKFRSWATPFRPGDCDNQIVKEVGSMILRGMDLEQITPRILARHLMIRVNDKYRVLTWRDVEFAYHVALLCLRQLMSGPQGGKR